MAAGSGGEEVLKVKGEWVVLVFSFGGIDDNSPIKDKPIKSVSFKCFL
jgi:hypothetical protein